MISSFSKEDEHGWWCRISLARPVLASGPPSDSQNDDDAKIPTYLNVPVLYVIAKEYSDQESKTALHIIVVVDTVPPTGSDCQWMSRLGSLGVYVHADCYSVYL